MEPNQVVAGASGEEADLESRRLEVERAAAALREAEARFAQAESARRHSERVALETRAKEAEATRKAATQAFLAQAKTLVDISMQDLAATSGRQEQGELAFQPVDSQSGDARTLAPSVEADEFDISEAEETVPNSPLIPPPLPPKP